MNQNKVILKCVYGSRLFGLETPESDHDYYEIFKADIEDIILKRDKECITVDNNNTQTKELRKFIFDAMKGQTYAIELLFAPSSMYIADTYLWEKIKLSRDKLLSRNLRPFLAYAQNQAKTYSYKTYQLKKLDRFAGEISKLDPNKRLQDVLDQITWDDNVLVEETPDGKQTFLKVISKRYNITCKIKDMMPSLNKLYGIYGERAHKNMEREYDPKAYSHALRLSYMLDELMTTGNISFPVINRDFLLEVKLGKIDVNIVRVKLAEILEKIDKNINVLPEQPDYEYWDTFMLDVYKFR